MSLVMDICRCASKRTTARFHTNRGRVCRFKQAAIWLLAASAGTGGTLMCQLSYAIGPAGPSWKPRELVHSGVEFQDQAGADRMLAFDHHGEPGIAFKAETFFGDIRYARNHPGFGWVAEDVFPQTNVNGRGPYASLAYDRHERPAISYLSADPNILDSALRISHYDGSQWQHQVGEFAQNLDIGSWTSLAFDHSGRAAVAYNDMSNARLRFLYDTDGDFDFSDEAPETIDAFGANEEAQYVSLAFDPLNRPMLSYVTERGELMFGMKETLEWLTRSIDTNEINIEIASSLAIDPDTGFPAIAYTSIFLNGSLKYAEWDGNDWVLQTVDGVGSTGLQPSLAFDPTDGNPAIAYHNPDNDDLRIAWHDGLGWQTGIVDANNGGGSIGINPSIAFREFGTGNKVAAIAYHDDSGNLYYIEDPPIVSVPEPATAWLALAASLVLWTRCSR